MACSLWRQVFPNLVENLRLILLKLAVTSETALQVLKKLCPCFQDMPTDVCGQEAEQQNGWILQGKEAHAKSILDYLLLSMFHSFD